MKRIYVLGIAAFLSLASCAPEEAAVCQHIAKVMEGDADKPGWVDNEDQCIKRFERIKNTHGVNSYRREVTCELAADTGFKMRKCLQKAAKGRSGPTI